MATQIVALKVQATGFAQIKKSLTKSLHTWTATFSHITMIVQGASRAFGVLSSAMAKPIALGEEYVRSQARINTVLDQLGKNTDTTRKSLIDYASAQALSSEYAEVEIKNLQALALNITRNTDVTNDLTKAAMSIAAAFGSDASQAIRNISKTFSGLKGELGEQVPAIRNMTKAQLMNGEAVKVIIDLYGSQLSAAVDTVGGRWNNLQTTIKDKYLVTVGRAIMDNKALAKGIESVTDSLAALAPEIGELKKPIHEVVMAMAKFTSQALGWSMSISDFVGDVSYKLADLGSDITELLLRPFEAIFALGESLAEYIDLPPWITERFVTLGDGIRQFGGAARESGRDVWDLTQTTTKGMALSKKILDDAIKAMEDYDGATKKATERKKSNAAREKDAEKEETAYTDRLSRRKEHLAEFLASRHVMYEGAAEKLNVLAEQQFQRQRQEMESLAAATMEFTAMTGQAIGENLAAVMLGAKTGAEALKDLTATVAASAVSSIAQIALTSITAFAADAAVKAGSAVALIPFIGPALAVSVAAAVLTAMLTYKGKIKGYATGGVVQGPPGRDNILARVSAGERIVPREQHRRYEKRGSGGVTVNMMVPQGVANRAETARFLRDVWAPGLRDLWDSGELDFMKAES